MKTWRDLNPQWGFMFWDENALNHHFPHGLRNQKQFDDMLELPGKCDIARYEILNKFGGFFIDADSICINKLDDFFLKNDCFSCYENEIAKGNLVSVGYLGSTKENKLMELLIEGIGVKDIKTILSPPKWSTEKMAWRMVGSGFLTTMIIRHRYTNISVYPSYYFIPEHYNGLKYTGPAKSYGKQFWGSTPESPFYGYDLEKIRSTFS